MKIEIRNGRIVDPANGVDRDGVAVRRRRQGRGDRRGAGGLAAPIACIDARGLVVAPGLIDLVRAAARAGPRVQGDARIGDGGGDRRRRHEPRVSAGHRSAARRAGPGRDAEAPRALAQPGARVSDRRADASAWRATTLTEMGELARSRMRRVLAGRRAARRHAGAAARDAVRARRSAIASGCGRRTRYLARGGVAHDGEVATRLGLPAIPDVGGDDRAVDDPRAGARDRRARAPVPAVVGGRRRDGARREDARACRSPATSRVHHLHLCDVDIGWFDAQARLDAAAARHARPRRAARRRRRRHDRPRLLRPRAGRRRRQAGAVRRGGAGRDRPRAPAAADAQVGGRGQASRCPARSHASRASRRAMLGVEAGRSGVGAAGGCLHLRSARRTGRSSAAALKSQGKNTPFLGLEVPGGCAARWSAGRSSTRRRTV